MKAVPKRRLRFAVEREVGRVAAVPVVWTGAWDVMDPKVLRSPAGTLLHEGNNW